jgi:hypothetical protein
MSLRVLFLIQFGVAALFSLSFLLMPKQAMKSFGVQDLNRQFVLLTRLYGSTVLMYCLVAWFAADVADSAVRRGIVIAFAASMGMGFVVFLPSMIRKILNSMGWIPTALQALFTAAYVYYAVTMTV